MTNGNDFITPIMFSDSIPNGEQNNGLTKREYFAAMAMQGVMIGLDYKHVDSSDKIALWAVIQSDALIKELNKTKQP